MMEKILYQQLLRRFEKQNDSRKWETHQLLERTHAGNNEKYVISATAANYRKHNDPRE